MESLLTAIRDVLARGGVAVIPTETQFGLAARALDEAACARVAAVKGRAMGPGMPVIIGAAEQLALVAAVVPAEAEALMRAFWPGPLSLVFQARPEVAAVARGPDDSVAVRWTPHAVAAELCRAVGPLVATSANRAGQPPPASLADLAAEIRAAVDAVAETDERLGGPPSTMVDARIWPPRLIREGAIPWRRVMEVLRTP